MFNKVMKKILAALFLVLFFAGVFAYVPRPSFLNDSRSSLREVKDAPFLMEKSWVGFSPLEHISAEEIVQGTDVSKGQVCFALGPFEDAGLVLFSPERDRFVFAGKSYTDHGFWMTSTCLESKNDIEKFRIEYGGEYNNYFPVGPDDCPNCTAGKCCIFFFSDKEFAITGLPNIEKYPGSFEELEKMALKRESDRQTARFWDGIKTFVFLAILVFFVPVACFIKAFRLARKKEKRKALMLAAVGLAWAAIMLTMAIAYINWLPT
jgi:hypothetical protein